jgi:hypothetical protein
MKLKDFFLALITHHQNIEIYVKRENRDPVFGFKINNIDSDGLYEINADLQYLVEQEIRDAFIESNSPLIDNDEGDTSYFLNSDLSCIKRAKYFDWGTESEQFWIDEHETDFNFENTNLPFHSIMITKELDSFVIYEEKTLKKILTRQQYEEFNSFYKELLNEFQEMQIELGVEGDDENGINCSIWSMYGSYRENMSFTLLDSSEVDFSKDDLKEMLSKYFSIEEQLTEQILDIKN